MDKQHLKHSQPRILIFTGGTLGHWALEYPQEGDILIGADRGASFLVKHNLRPDLALGDFDSVTEIEFAAIQARSLETQTCDPVMKDYSDTELAFHAAAARRPREIIIIGALGSRFDHSLANVHLLRKALLSGIPCRLVDEHNEIQLTDHTLVVANPVQKYAYVSLLPLSLEVTGVTLTGFQYPLQDAVLSLGQSLAVSNKLDGEQGTVQIQTGLLLVIQSKDE